jgi:hypothetical protein
MGLISVLTPEALKGAESRYARFEPLFRAHRRMLACVDAILEQNTATLKDGAEELSVVVGTSLTKSIKTFEGIRTLCLLGWGEDALVLLRSNVNLCINLGYIISDAEPVERAADFIAFSCQERERYLKTALGVERPARSSPMTDEERKTRAKRWAAVGIAARAQRTSSFHYILGYTLYSSFEHSDAAALDTYITDWDEVGPHAHASPRDDHLRIALPHSVIVLADVLRLFCKHFDIDRPDVFAEVVALIESIGEREGREGG